VKSSAPRYQGRSRALPLTSGLFLGLVATTCARATPIGLSDARVAYVRVSAGPAAQLAPEDLQKARFALDQAEQSFAAGKDELTTADLAWAAERAAELAQEHGEVAMAKKNSTEQPAR
jgi:hypothetical protein